MPKCKKRKLKPRARKKVVSKRQLCEELLQKNPDISADEACEMVDCNGSVFYTVRKRLRAGTGNGSMSIGLDEFMGDLKTIKKIGIPRAEAAIAVIKLAAKGGG